jgi:hypothetical protein
MAARPELKAQLLTLLELAESGIERVDEVDERTVKSFFRAAIDISQGALPTLVFILL